MSALQQQLDAAQLAAATAQQDLEAARKQASEAQASADSAQKQVHSLQAELLDAFTGNAESAQSLQKLRDQVCAFTDLDRANPGRHEAKQCHRCVLRPACHSTQVNLGAAELGTRHSCLMSQRPIPSLPCGRRRRRRPSQRTSSGRQRRQPRHSASRHVLGPCAK